MLYNQKNKKILMIFLFFQLLSYVITINFLNLMTLVLVLYYSKTGNTKQIADVIHETVAINHESTILPIDKCSIEDVNNYDLLFIGSACNGFENTIRIVETTKIKPITALIDLEVMLLSFLILFKLLFSFFAFLAIKRLKLISISHASSSVRRLI